MHSLIAILVYIPLLNPDGSITAPSELLHVKEGIADLDVLFKRIRARVDALRSPGRDIPRGRRGCQDMPFPS